MARLVLSLPLVAMDSVGAGAGSFVRIDPYTKTIKLGPDSAGYRVGVCWKEGGIETVTVSDCHVVLGYLNPDNFLGGQFKLDPAARDRRHQDADRRSAAPFRRRRCRRRDRAAGQRAARISAVDDRGQGLQPAEFRLLLLRRRRPGACLRLYRRAGLQGRDRPGVGRGLLGLWLRLLQISSTATTRVSTSTSPRMPTSAADRGGEGGAGGMGGADEERHGGVPDQRLQPEQVLLQPGYRMQYMRPAQ